MNQTLLIAILASTLAGGLVGGLVGFQLSEPSPGEAGFAPGDLPTRSSDRTGSANPASTARSGENPAANRSQGFGTFAPDSLAEIFSLPSRIDRWSAMIRFFSQMDADELATLYAEQGPFNFDFDELAKRQLLLSRWAELDPLGALAAVGGEGGREAAMGKMSILKSWASSDPVAAAAYYSANQDALADGNRFGGRGPSNVSAIAGEWAKQDPEGALSWASSLSDDSGQRSAMEAIFGELAKTDPAAAASQAMAALSGQNLEGAFRQIGRTWAGQDQEAALAWARSLTGEEAASGVSSVLRGISDNDPEAALRLLAEFPAAAEDERLVGRLTDEWAEQDPQSTAEWVSDLPEGEAKATATTELVREWMRSDQTEAMSWVKEQPAGPSRDNAVAGLVQSLRNSDPESAVTEWATAIQDEGLRNRTILSSLGRWARQDSSAAIEWAETTDSLNDQAFERAASLLQRAAEGGGGGPPRPRGER
ncbi:MAG: hypothetical protein AAF555_11010 [Verrucomicrobiota bacterium]